MQNIQGEEERSRQEGTQSFVFEFKLLAYLGFLIQINYKLQVNFRKLTFKMNRWRKGYKKLKVKGDGCFPIQNFIQTKWLIYLLLIYSNQFFLCLIIQTLIFYHHQMIFQHIITPFLLFYFTQTKLSSIAQSQEPSSDLSQKQKLSKGLSEIDQQQMQRTSENTLDNKTLEVELRDGKTIFKAIDVKKEVSFFYHNMSPEGRSLYLSLTINNSKALESFQMAMYYYKDRTNKDKEKFSPQIPSIQVQSPSTSMLYQLNHQYQFIQMVFKNNYGEPIKLSLTLNHEEIIFLPLDHKLPVKVHKDSAVNLLVDNSEEGYIEVSISRCDESNPSMAYAFTSEDLQQQNYETVNMLNGEMDRIYTYQIRTKRQRDLYIRIVGDSVINSQLEITASYLKENRKKIESQFPLLHPGEHGKLKYQLLTTKKAQITFAALDCGLNCRDKINYFVISSNSKSDLYRRIVCPTTYFFTRSDNIKTTVQKIQVKPSKGDNKISFKHMMNFPIMYVTIKAESIKSKKQIFYSTLQIVTIWGQLNRISKGFLFLLCAISFIGLALLIYIVRRQAKKGYKRIRIKS